MKRAVIYLRVSTSKQATRDLDPEGYSIPAQREACRRTASGLGAEVVDEYIDRGESARSADRPALQDMLERVRTAGDIDYVIVHKVDRLARNRADDVVIGLTLRESGVQLASATENIDETPSGVLLHGIMASIAEFYSRNLAAEVVKGLVQKAKQGGTPFRAPPGYTNVRSVNDGESRTVALDPERAPLIKWAFEVYATGEYSLSRLCDELNEKGYRTRSGPNSTAKRIGKQSLVKVLRNPYYLGIVSYKSVHYEGRHKALVAKDTFTRVHNVLEAHRASGEKQRRHNHYLKGTVYCGQCGSRMLLTLAKGRRKGGEWLYFFCDARRKQSGCGQSYVLASRVERAVIDYYSTVQLGDERVTKVRTELKRQLATLQRRNSSERSRQGARIARLRVEREKLMHAYYDGAVADDLLKSEQLRINRELADAERALALAETELGEAEPVIEQALFLAANCREAYEQAPPAVRRMFNQLLFKRVLVTDERVSGAEMSDPYAAILADGFADRSQRRSSGRVVHSASGSTMNALVGLSGLEPPTSALSELRSNRLSYRPKRRHATSASAVFRADDDPADERLDVVVEQRDDASHKAAHRRCEHRDHEEREDERQDREAEPGEAEARDEPLDAAEAPRDEADEVQSEERDEQDRPHRRHHGERHDHDRADIDRPDDQSLWRNSTTSGGHAYPFTTASGRKRATRLDRPAASHTETTSETSLYAYGASSASKRSWVVDTRIPWLRS